MIGVPGSINVFKANDNVSSIVTIPAGETVIFKAGQDIDLNRFFEVEMGAQFVAEIEGCFDALQSESLKEK